MKMGAEAIVITEKDAVKIPAEVIRARWNMPVYVICVEVTFTQGGGEFQQLLQQDIVKKLGRQPQAPAEGK